MTWFARQHQRTASARSQLADEVQDKLSEVLSNVQLLTKRDESEQQEAREELKNEIMSVVESRVAACRQAICAALDDCTAEIKAGVTEAVNPEAVQEKRRRFGEKTFGVHDSPVTKMLTKQDFQSIYNIFITIMVWLGVNILLQEWFVHHRLVDTSMFFIAFGKMEYVLSILVMMNFWCTLMVPFVQAINAGQWRAKRWLWVYGLYHAALLSIPSYYTVHLELPIASGLIVMCEMARLCMKSHAYVREKILYGMMVPGSEAKRSRSQAPTPTVSPKVSSSTRAPGDKTPAATPTRASTGSAASSGTPAVAAAVAAAFAAAGASGEGSPSTLVTGQRVYAKYADFIPEYAQRMGVTVADIHQPHITIGDTQTELGRFFYFLFAPTLIYRDHYPRSGNQIRWIQALVHFLNMLGVLAYMFLIFQSFCIPSFSDTTCHPGDVKAFVNSVMQSMVPGMAVLIMMFYGVLHTWLNLWAELLRFGDRRFYEDWWNARSFASYYRKWNMVVHEFLFYYMYQDAIRFSLGKWSKGMAMALVFIVSSIIHEQIIACAIGFWYPVLLLMFGGPGVIFVKIAESNSRMSNVFLWLMLSVGMGLLLVLYSREWFARYGHHPVEYPLMNEGLMIFVPRSFLAFYFKCPEPTA